MEDIDPLTDKQRRFIELHASGLDKVQAALRAGYGSKSGAKKASSRLMKNQTILAAIAKIRDEGMKLAAYGLEAAMREANDAARFAREHKNPMALVKATELRAKLAGLLVNRIEITPIDLRGALELAKQRVVILNTPASQPRVELGSLSDQTAIVGGAHWPPVVPGNSDRAP